MVALSLSDINKFKRIVSYKNSITLTSNRPYHQEQSYQQYDQDTTFVNEITKQQKRFTDSEIPELASDYKSGMTVYELADKYGCHRNTISKTLKKHGVNVTIQKITTDEELQKLMYLRKTGSTNEQTAQQLGINQSTVKRYFRLLRET